MEEGLHCYRTGVGKLVVVVITVKFIFVYYLRFRSLIIQNFIPPDEKQKLTNRAVYDEENEQWRLKPSSQNSR